MAPVAPLPPTTYTDVNSITKNDVIFSSGGAGLDGDGRLTVGACTTRSPSALDTPTAARMTTVTTTTRSLADYTRVALSYHKIVHISRNGQCNRIFTTHSQF